MRQKLRDSKAVSVCLWLRSSEAWLSPTQTTTTPAECPSPYAYTRPPLACSASLITKSSTSPPKFIWLSLSLIDSAVTSSDNVGGSAYTATNLYPIVR